jgi:hypothetical protein
MNEDNDKKIITVVRKLCIKDSLINSIPMILGTFFWFMITWIGVRYIQIQFINNAMHPIVLIIWIFMMMHLSKKMIPFGVTTYEDEESERSL